MGAGRLTLRLPPATNTFLSNSIGMLRLGSAEDHGEGVGWVRNAVSVRVLPVNHIRTSS